MNDRLFLNCKHLIALLVAGIWALGLHGQSAVADSLGRLLRSAPADTHRVSLLTDYAWEINETQTDAAAKCLNDAIQLAQRLKFIHGEASAWNGMGIVEEIRGNYEKAKNYYQKALGLRRQTGELNEIGASLNNLGVLFEMMGNLDSALVYHRENLAIQQELRDTVRIARAHFNIAAAYQEMGFYPEAQKDLYEARSILEVQNDRDGMAKVAAQLGHIKFELERYHEARDLYAKELDLREQLNDPARLAEALTDYANALDELDSSQLAIGYYIRALDLWKELDDLPGQANVFINLADAHKHLGNFKLALEYLDQALKICKDLNDVPSLMETYNVMGDVYSRAGQQQKSLELVQKYFAIATKIGDTKFIQSALKDFAEVYAAMGNFETAYNYRVQYDSLRFAKLNEKSNDILARKELIFASEQKEKEIEQQKHALQLNQAQLAKSRTRNYALFSGALALLLLVALLYNRNRLRARNNRELATKNKLIESERQRSDTLLLNILPATTAAELKANDAVQPVRYESVTVMFTDFEQFTKIAETVRPEELIGELDECFRLFDTIVSEFNLEKIKTIGDAYMCAGGLPVANQTHPIDVVHAAVAMQCRLRALMQQKEAEGKPVFRMRIGIHTGPVVAGVVGSHKFAYDIWGDTVNTAARLEQGSESGKINISETTYQQVRNTFPCTFRGHLTAKNKGEIAMYFVNFTC